MTTVFEVWYETADGIQYQEVGADDLPIEHASLVQAQRRATELLLSEEVERTRVWVVKKEMVWERRKK